MNAEVTANTSKSSYKGLYDEFSLKYSYSGIQNGMQENYLRFKAHLEHSNSWFRYGKGTQTLAIDVNADLNVIEQSQFIISANPHLPSMVNITSSI